MDEFQKGNERWSGSEPWQYLCVWRLWVVDSLFPSCCLTGLSSRVYCHHLLSFIMNCSDHLTVLLTGKASALCPGPNRRVRHHQLHHNFVPSLVNLEGWASMEENTDFMLTSASCSVGSWDLVTKDKCSSNTTRCAPIRVHIIYNATALLRYTWSFKC